MQFKLMVENEYKSVIKCLHIDNGGEFLSHEFSKFFEEHGIKRQITCPSTSQHNGVVERRLAHLTTITLSWLYDKNLPQELWAVAMQCACHMINRLPPWLDTSKSPFEMLYNTKVDVSYFKVFGSLCYVHITKHNRTKLDLKARKCLFVGYDAHRKGCKCMDPVTKKIVTSCNVVFVEVSTLYPDFVHEENFEFVPLIDSCIELIPLESESNERGMLKSTSQNDPAQGKATPRRTSRQSKLPNYLND